MTMTERRSVSNGTITAALYLAHRFKCECDSAPLKTDRLCAELRTNLVRAFNEWTAGLARLDAGTR
jgi:hypothetical protein